MSIGVLVQVHEEARRLAIAGAAVASGDFRLKKLVAPLEQAGAKAPVFARVAQAAQAVVDSNEKNASAALLDLATLVNAILYTQGETGIAGEMTTLETTGLDAGETQASARVLKPLLDALGSTGSGRLELVRDAIERGIFRDLRLVRPSLNALDDPYPEIAALVAAKVLPLYRKAILPELRAKLDLKGGGGNVHRLQLLHKIDPEGTRAIIKQALEDGSREIRVAAVECLGTAGDDLVCLLDQVKSKAKDVRAAALRALAGARSAAAEIVAALKRAIDGSDLELIADRLTESEIPDVRDYVLAQAEKQILDTLSEKDAKKQGTAIERLMQFSRTLHGRTDAKAEAFLIKCFDAVPALAKIKSTPSGQDFNELLARVMSEGTATLQRRLAAAHKTLSGEMLGPAYAAARETFTPAEFYKEFSPLLVGLKAKGGKKGGAAERAEALAGVLVEGYELHAFVSWRHFEADSEGRKRRELDPLWLDAAVETGSVQLVCGLARAGHARTNKFLLEQLKTTKPVDRHILLDTMVKMGHPGAADAIIDSLKQQAKAAHHGYHWYWYTGMIAALPGSDYPKFEAILPTLPEKMVDQLMDSVIELKSKTA